MPTHVTPESDPDEYVPEEEEEEEQNEPGLAPEARMVPAGDLVMGREQVPDSTHLDGHLAIRETNEESGMELVMPL